MVNIDLESKFVLILIAVLYVLGVYLTNAMSKAEVLQWVKRRRGNDYYKYINSSESKCDKNTYLICERQCVNDQELFEGNNIIITIMKLIGTWWLHYRLRIHGHSTSDSIITSHCIFGLKQAEHHRFSSR